MKKRFSFLLLLPLLLVSCINFGGKLDSVGRRDAVFDPRKEVTTRCRIGEKTYVPVTIRYCDAQERCYDDIYYAFGGAYCTGEPEPQGREVTLWTEYTGDKDRYYTTYRPLLAEEEPDMAHAVKEEGKAVPQSRLILSGKGQESHVYYWRKNPDHNVFDPANPRLCFVRDIAPERTLGNRLRRPLTYALKAVDIPLSCISVPATLICELFAPSIFIQSAPVPAPPAAKEE